ncbi:ABC transporter substrate-binding protein, partial [Lachnoclostridium phytofermentans]|uniref:ABC transporter substrate-binding protein n=1 Tax=Lachnoclostridium phytofermentans TaxID=66219 RepID=UPI0004965414
MKKLVSMMLVLAMCMTLFSGCVFAGKEAEDTSGKKDNQSSTATPGGNGNEGTTPTTGGEQGTDSALPPMTTEPITLTYFNFDSEVLTQKLAEKFMEKYPNITVNVVYVNVADANTTLLNLIAANNAPDCFMYSDSDFALSNHLLYDMTELWEADPENQNVLPTINELKIGYYDTNQKWGTPMKFFPGIVYVDRGVLETLNIDMPRMDWTWDEMIKLIQDSTDLSQTPAYYGLGAFNRLDSLYGIAASQKIKGEFGWDGESFDLGVWAVGEQQFADLKLNNYVAPNTETAKMEKWLGDWEAWAGASGRVAVMTEAYWTYMNIWDTEAFKDLGIDFVPYVIPSVEEVDGVPNSIATLDMGGISAGTKYPREAYELLKFMGWGTEGWQAKLDIYYDQSITNAAGDPLIRDSMPAPITLDESVWSRYKELYPTDQERKPYWDAYFASCIRPVPFGWMSIAGYWTFCDEYFNNLGIHNLVDTGQAKASDYAEEATKMANQYHKEAMKAYFGIDLP